MSLLLILLLIAHVCQAYYWLVVFDWGYSNPRSDTHCGSQDGSQSASPYPGVSIIVAVKNEAAHLVSHLPLILSQRYPYYEVIVVDDHSTDITSKILHDFASHYEHLKLLTLEVGQGKKAALTLGILHARYPWILCTDADCSPMSDIWIQSMMRLHTCSDLILGYGPYKPSATVTLVNLLITYETWYIAHQYFSAAHRGKPYMGVGRNLCYRKSAFEEINGFGSHEHILSGDDDLFIASLSHKRVSIEKSPSSWTISAPPTSLRQMWNQKRRHLTTAFSYTRQDQLRLLVLSVSHILIYLLTTMLMYAEYYGVLIPFLVRWAYMYVASRKSMKQLGCQYLWPWMTICDFLLAIYYAAHAVGSLRSKKDW